MSKDKKPPALSIVRRKVTLTNAELVAANDALEKIAGSTYAGTLTFRIALLLRLLRPLREALIEALKNPAAWDNERIALCEEFAEKNAKGEPIREDGSYKISDKAGFNTALAALNKKHGLDRRQEENKELLAATVEVQDLPVLDVAAIPENWSPNIVAALLPLCDAQL